MDFTNVPYVPKGATIPGLLRQRSEEDPNKLAFRFIDKYWNKTDLTRKDVWDQSRKFAAILRRHGIKKGDVVCNTLPNSPERLVTCLGTVVSGAVSMHGQVMLADGEDIIYSCQLSKCKAIIVDPGDQNGAFSTLHRLQDGAGFENGKLQCHRLPDLSIMIKVNVRCYDNKSMNQRGLRFIEEEEDEYEDEDQTEDHVAYVFTTSGTTGFSKLVPHTHGTSLRVGRLLAVLSGLQLEESTYFSDRSLGWLGGFPGPYMVCGATRVLTDLAMGLPDAIGEHVFRILQEERVDCAILLTRDIESTLNLIASGKCLKRRLRAFGVTGMPLSRRILRALGSISDAINVGYGSTEVGYVAVMHVDANTTFEDYCVGANVDGYEIKIVDENLKEVPPGQLGQVMIRSPTRTPGYLNEPEKTRKDFTDDGYFLVGDVAYKDEKGFFYVMGRQSDAIMRGTVIHYPGWIESRILKCPGVQQVSVIGVPDPVYFHEICVCVIPPRKDDLDECGLQEYCKTLFLSHAKSEFTAVPKYYLIFDAFPLNANGKLDRKALKTQACKLLGIDC